MTACGSLCPFITALGRLTLAKTARRRLRPPYRAFFWPCAAFACLYRLYTDASSNIYLCGGIIQILVAEYLHKWIPCLPGRTARRGNCVWREDVQHRPAGSRNTLDDHSLGECMEAKTKLLDHMRH